MLLIDYMQYRAFTAEPTVENLTAIENRCKSLNFVCNTGYSEYSLQNPKCSQTSGLYIYPHVTENTTTIHLSQSLYINNSIRVNSEEMLELLDIIAVYGLELGLEVFYQAWATKPGNLLFAGAYYDYEDRQ